MPSSQNGNLGIWSGYTAGDNGWTAQHNANWDTIDAVVMMSCISITITTPPGSPANGNAYIVPSGATGAWASQTNKIAVWFSRGTGAWQFFTPKNGWIFYNQADSMQYLYNGSAWVIYDGPRLSPQSDFISGLKLIWNSATSITVGTGSAFISSLNRLSLVNAALTLSSLSLTASTWYHVYLYENAGTPTIECVTTAPASYFANAWQKTGDSSRRYLGSILTDSSGNVYAFQHDGYNGMAYLNCGTGAAPFRVLSGGAATTSTSVSLSGVIPVTAPSVLAKFNNLSTTGSVNFQQAVGSAIVFGLSATLAGLTLNTINLMPTANQAMAYICATTGGNTSIDVIGYIFSR